MSLPLDQALPLLAGDEKFDPLAAGEWSLFFWLLVVFLLLLAILSKALWKPLIKAIETREQKIADDLNAAERARWDAEEIRNHHRQELEAAAGEAKRLIEEARSRAAELKSELETDARREAEELIAKARQSIAAEKTQALSDIRQHIVELSMEVTRRVVGQVGATDDHARVADQLIAKVRDAS